MKIKINNVAKTKTKKKMKKLNKNLKSNNKLKKHIQMKFKNNKLLLFSFFCIALALPLNKLNL